MTVVDTSSGMSMSEISHSLETVAAFAVVHNANISNKDITMDINFFKIHTPLNYIFKDMQKNR